MESIDRALSPVVARLSDENYSESFAFYRFWFDIGQKYHQIPSDQVFDNIWNNRGTRSKDPGNTQLIHLTAHLVLRFARDAESDPILAPHSSGLQSRLSARSLRDFFSNNLIAVAYKEADYTDGGGGGSDFYTDANLIAHWANLGYMEEAAIRDHILQSLISHPKLHGHQADALLILFKLAGATFEAYVDPLVIDRCFELLKVHFSHDVTTRKDKKPSTAAQYYYAKREMVQVRAPRVVKGGHLS